VDEAVGQHRTAMTVKLIAIEAPNLDTTCYRGSAALADLARISQADIFDQIDNPDGLQRDLNRKHAATPTATPPPSPTPASRAPTPRSC
jgi:hypothetical protein